MSSRSRYDRKMRGTVQREATRLIAEEYDRLSRKWDRHFVTATKLMRERVIQAALLRPGNHVLDVGTGTGAAAFQAARRVGRRGFVLGIDLSPEMLRTARRKAASRGSTNVHFRRMDATAPRLTGGSFDGVISSFGTPDGAYDGAAVFREWHRVLRPGGRLCFVEAAWSALIDPILERTLAKYRVKDPSPKLAARRRTMARVRQERKHLPLISADDPPKVKRLMEAAGFRDVRAVTRRSLGTFPSDRAVLDIVLSLGAEDEVREMPPAAQAGFRREILVALRPYASRGGTRLPARAVLFFGRKALR